MRTIRICSTIVGVSERQTWAILVKSHEEKCFRTALKMARGDGFLAQSSRVFQCEHFGMKSAASWSGSKSRDENGRASSYVSKHLRLSGIKTHPRRLEKWAEVVNGSTAPRKVRDGGKMSEQRWKT